ncbi:MAG TPA: hypothetical protein VM493_01920 [Vicinamibacterales bacterium]|jgi:hypothetical protein|nr:hypothetical protein [Vicinamibacterales bacterium]
MAADRSPGQVKRERALVVLWLVMALLLWNGVYDMTVGEGIKEYLFRSALYEAGRAPNVSIASVLDPYIFDAAWVSTFWASLVMLAGLLTIRVMRRSHEA